jgi:hypothetical protein
MASIRLVLIRLSRIPFQIQPILERDSEQIKTTVYCGFITDDSDGVFGTDFCAQYRAIDTALGKTRSGPGPGQAPGGPLNDFSADVTQQGSWSGSVAKPPAKRLS